jgi:ribonucleotide reductase beta subunit family protein with ferritin-like domain
MPDGLLGLSKDMMKTYCKYIADTILVNFGSTPIYNVNQPLDYMEKLAIPRKTNFFEKRVADYTRADNAEMDITLEDF